MVSRLIKRYLNIKTVTSMVLFFLSVSAFSQRYSNKGDRYFDRNLFNDAIKYYQLEIKGRDRIYSIYAKQKLATCYRILGKFELAEETYKSILKKKKNQEDYRNSINYGNALKSNGKYNEASVQFEKYIKLNPSDPLGFIFLYSCDSAQLWMEELDAYKVKNVLKINSSYSDFGPVYLDSNNLVFTSSRDGSKEALLSFDGGEKFNRLDLYSVNISSLNSDDKAVKCQNLTGINTPMHEGSATFSSDGNEIYFTRTIKGKKNKKKNEILSNLKVLYSRKDSLGKWSDPISAFPFNSDKYSIGQPSLSNDGGVIYFMSDMPGGFGGTDIYYSEKKEDGTWIDPINAGKEVNTFGNELFPYISNSGKLYFSSDTHIGMGSLDIFSSTFNKKKGWINIENLKPPINSSSNDFGIAFEKNNNSGFFSSDRYNGVGAEDIYSFSKIDSLDKTFTDNQVLSDSVSIRGIVEDNSGKRLSAKAIISVDNQILKTIDVEADGNFLISVPRDLKLSIKVISDGYYTVIKTISEEDYKGHRNYKAKFEPEVVFH